MPEKDEEKQQRHFSLLTIENVVQTCVLLLGIAIGYGNLSASVGTNARDINGLRLEHGLLSTEVTKLQTDCAAMQARLNQVENAQAATTQARDSDRRVLMDINAKVEVLLDRTDPKKGAK